MSEPYFKKRIFGRFILTFAFLFFVGIAIVYAAQWNEPSAQPPGNNVESPINISGTAQTKTGSLGANGGFFVDGYEMVGSNGDMLYANRRNTTGGGIWVSDDGGFYDYNNGFIDFRGTTGLKILENNGTWGDNSIRAAYLCIQDNCVNSWGQVGGYWGLSGTSLYPTNNGWNIAIGTTDPAGYKLRVVGTVRGTAFYDENNPAFYLDPNSVSILNDVRASIFYDRDNTGYYVNPYGSSRLANIYADYIRSYGNLDVDGAIYDGNDGDVNIGESLYVSGTGTFTSSVAIAANQRYYFNGQGGARYFYDDNANNRIGISTTLYMNNQTINGVYQINQNNGNWNLYSNGNAYFAGSITVGGGIQMGAYQTLYSPGRMHINGEEILYLLNKSGVIVSKAWGGNGNLTVEGNLDFGKGGSAIYDNANMVFQTDDNWYWYSTWHGHNEMKLNYVNGDLSIRGSYYCNQSIDVAEMIYSNQKTGLEAGDVVVVDPDNDETVILSSKPYDSTVAGIISTEPGLVLGSGFEGDTAKGDVELSLVGRVPCKVTTENGSVKRGDLLVTSSKPGYAMKGEPKKIKEMPGVVLGKALEELKEGEGKILVLISLR